jgi:hypothetical protein
MPETLTEKNLSQRALEIAKSQEGVEEQPRGSNCGPQINQYLKSVGLGPGNPWCMAAVYWCVNQAAIELGIKNPLVKTGLVKKQWETTTCKKLPNRSGGVKPGSLFVMLFKNNTGHIGFVEKIVNGIVFTREGNTNDDGGREGFKWATRQRPISTIAGFIQLS